MQKVKDSVLEQVTGGFNYIDASGEYWAYLFSDEELELINRYKTKVRSTRGSGWKVPYSCGNILLRNWGNQKDTGATYYLIEWVKNRHQVEPKEVEKVLSELREKKQSSFCTIV